MLVVPGHAHRAWNDTLDYLCRLHDELSTFMQCTIELSFIIRWNNDSVLMGLSVSYSSDLQATCKELERRWKQVRGFGKRWSVHPYLEAWNHRDNCVIRNQATM